MNVVTHQVALGSKALKQRVPGPDLSTYNLLASFQVSDPGYSERARGWTMKHADEEENIEVVTLDSYVGQLPRLDLLKIDVEDMEEAVVLGAQALIAEYRPKVWAENA